MTKTMFLDADSLHTPPFLILVQHNVTVEMILKDHLSFIPSSFILHLHAHIPEKEVINNSFGHNN